MDKLYVISQGKNSTLNKLIGGANGNASGAGVNVTSLATVGGAANQSGLMSQSQTDNILGLSACGAEVGAENNSQIINSKLQGSSVILASSNSLAYLKSLNMPYKKREAERIDGDNLRMIERIMQTGSAIPSKQYEDDYSKHLRVKKQIMKANPIPIEKILMKK